LIRMTNTQRVLDCMRRLMERKWREDNDAVTERENHSELLQISIQNEEKSVFCKRERERRRRRRKHRLVAAVMILCDVL